MTAPKISLFPKLEEFIQSLNLNSIPENRKAILQPLIDYINEKLARNQELNLNFICTHNSRRSQFAQVWAHTIAAYFGLDLKSYSGGVEVTAFNPRAIQALQRAGFQITQTGEENPVYTLSFADNADTIKAFSKLFDDESNPRENFAAVMTCSHADENCPFIPGTEKRIALNYDDPKEYDDTSQETEKYDERCRQIATEMFYAFGNVEL